MNASAATEAAVKAADVESRVLLRNIPWDLYERLRDADDTPGVRMTYARGRLEIMCPSQSHEENSDRLSMLVFETAKILGLPCKPLRSTTWKKPDEAAKEADACFYLANATTVRHKTIDLTVDPPPDLAIEVEISPPRVDVESVYAALGVPEIWRFDGETLRVLVRREDGSYDEREQSACLPFLPMEEVLRLVREAEALDDDPRWVQQVARWVEAEIAPRHRREHGDEQERQLDL